MINFFAFGRSPSHYEEHAPGPTIEVTVPLRTLNEKIVEVCQGKREDAREEYTPAKDLTEAQLRQIKEFQEEREQNRRLFDLGLWLASPRTASFRIKEVSWPSAD